MAEEALTSARDSDSLAEWADSLTTLAMLAEKSGDIGLTEELLDKARAVAARSGDTTVQMRILHNQAIVAARPGRPADGARAGDRPAWSSPSSTAWRSVAGGCSCGTTRTLLFQLGDWDEAEPLTSYSDRVGGLVSAFMLTFACQPPRRPRRPACVRPTRPRAAVLGRGRPARPPCRLPRGRAGHLAAPTTSGRASSARLPWIMVSRRLAAQPRAGPATPPSVLPPRPTARRLPGPSPTRPRSRGPSPRATGCSRSPRTRWPSGTARTGAPGVEAQAWLARVQAENSRLDGAQ